MSILGYGSLEAAMAMGRRVEETTGKKATVRSDGKLYTVELPPLTAAEYDELRSGPERAAAAVDRGRRDARRR